MYTYIYVDTYTSFIDGFPTWWFLFVFKASTMGRLINDGWWLWGLVPCPVYPGMTGRRLLTTALGFVGTDDWGVAPFSPFCDKICSIFPMISEYIPKIFPFVFWCQRNTSRPWRRSSALKISWWWSVAYWMRRDAGFVRWKDAENGKSW